MPFHQYTKEVKLNGLEIHISTAQYRISTKSVKWLMEYMESHIKSLNEVLRCCKWPSGFILQNWQCTSTYNVATMRVCATIVAVENQ